MNVLDLLFGYMADAARFFLRQGDSPLLRISREQIETALTDAVNAWAALGAIGATKDADKLSAAHGAFAAKVKTVLEIFPDDLRPKPRAPKK
ncbi:MAG TPA: hypothetical protein VHO24_18855 [Opitutaceae bacterium]|nr:hypothetical protein [Opitutaceae bacterium]